MGKKLKKILLIILIIIFIFVLCLLINKAYEEKMKDNINNMSWLRKNVSISENLSIGKNVLSVNKHDEINVYSDSYQTVINEKINDLKNEGNYTLEDPLLIYNAYGTNSSSINIYFNTDKESHLKYTVNCDDKDINDYTKTLYNGYINNLTTNHEYQITGLVAGKKQDVTFELYDKDNNIIDRKK